MSACAWGKEEERVSSRGKAGDGAVVLVGLTGTTAMGRQAGGEEEAGRRGSSGVATSNGEGRRGHREGVGDGIGLLPIQIQTREWRSGVWGDGEWVRVSGVWPYRAADCGVARPGSGLVGRSP